MNIDLAKLTKPLTIDEDITIDLNEYSHHNIKALKNLHVSGTIGYNAIDNLALDLRLTGTMILEDSVTLEDINYPLDLKINEEYEINPEFLQVYTTNQQNILDILRILWENIVLEVPMRLTTTKDAKLSGEGWSLGGEDNIEEIDPRLAKLAELLTKRKE